MLDFAFHIHSKLGCKCIGVQGKRQERTVEADTEQRRPGGNHDVQYTDAQAGLAEHRHHFQGRAPDTAGAQEMAARQHAFAKETLERKFKNRKIEYDEGTMMRLIKRLGFKVVTDFYQSIADETLDVNGIIDKYLELQKRENDTHDDIVYRSAEGYNLQAAAPTRRDRRQRGRARHRPEPERAGLQAGTLLQSYLRR